MGYEVKPVILKSSNKRHPKIPEPLPTLPFAITCVAPRNSGKTSLICGLIKDVYRKAFEQIIIASPTVKLDATFQELAKYKNIGVIDTVNNETLSDIFQTQKGVFQADSKAATMLYIDDAGDWFRRKEAQKLINVLYTTSRHSNLHLICCVQSVQHLSSVQKSNSSQWIVFKTDDRAMKQLADQLQSAHKTPKQVYEFLLDATKERHSFAYIDFSANDEHTIYRHGFR